ncbi:MAG: hypothetical protein FJZ09_03530 [Candidatus Omnitrophica bacterium]|nr:hypothetical protein [Candidatus Omnitrophota bacterium]
MFMQKYRLEFILHSHNASVQSIRSSLAEFGEHCEISPLDPAASEGNNFRVNMDTEEPAMVFDLCSQIGRIRSVKIDEIK